MNLHSYSHLIPWKVAQNIHWGKGSLFNKCSWENRISTCRTLKVDLCLSPCTNINLKRIKDFHIKPETLKFL
jgi:hypothetical protein